MALTTFDPTQFSTNTFLGIGKNRIINGEMAIDQANGGTVVTVNGPTGFFGADMFQALGQSADGVFTMQQLSATPPTGFQYYQRLTTTTADASVGATQQYFFRQIIEGTSIRDFQAGSASSKTFTLSFWVRSSLTGTFGGSIMNGAQNRSYVFNYTINSANTWEQKTVTVVGDITGTWTVDTGAGLRVFWDVGAGSNFEATAGSWGAGFFYRSSGNTRLISTNAATLDITGIQLELGSGASAFEYRPFQMEFSLCERYYQRYGGVASVGWLAVNQAISTSTSEGAIRFRTLMRASPTMSIQNVGSFILRDAISNNLTCTSSSFDNPNNSSVRLGLNTTSGLVAGNATTVAWTNANAAIIADARL